MRHSRAFMKILPVFTVAARSLWMYVATGNKDTEIMKYGGF